jgi:hypothetical protein
MRLTILPRNPRLPDDPMMTLIAGQPNAAATDLAEMLRSQQPYAMDLVVQAAFTR